MTSEYINFTSSINVIRAGSDSVTVMSNMNLAYIIDRIYRIKSDEEMAAIKNQILRNHKKPEPIKGKFN